jgi:precorrin-6B methylase 1
MTSELLIVVGIGHDSPGGLVSESRMFILQARKA